MTLSRIPKYGFHKPSGQARVYVDGQSVYLGPFDSDESKRKYKQVIEQWQNRRDLARRRQELKCLPELSVGELALLYDQHAASYYVKNDEPTSEVLCLKAAIKFVIRAGANVAVADFGPKRLKAVRERMIVAGQTRTTINKNTERIKRMFAWGVSEELVPPDVITALRTVRGLALGRSEARERPPIKPVSLADVFKIRHSVSRQVFGMAILQLHTGMRPGEVVQLRERDLDTGELVWTFTPTIHKNQHLGQRRVISIGPRAQRILRKFLKGDRDAFLFSPTDAEFSRNKARRASRRSPMTPSHSARMACSKPARPAGERYSAASYRRAIARGCDAAGIPPWRPNQARHWSATRIRRIAGLEKASVVLGHSNIETSQIYAEADLEAARGVMAEIG